MVKTIAEMRRRGGVCGHGTQTGEAAALTADAAETGQFA
jgi:hypothetical protein